MKQCLETVREGRNMTEVLAALNVLAATDSEERDIALATFYDEWKENNLVILKWLGIQAIAPREDALQIVKSLIEHESFDMTVPNKVRPLRSEALRSGFLTGRVCLTFRYTLFSEDLLPTTLDTTVVVRRATILWPTKSCDWTSSTHRSLREWRNLSLCGSSTNPKYRR
mmetsp:Transcript_13322/g.53178  ORF Transcript_13322/g.53178 Transcript_13322/m.53178 type:complete len:169 (-) Transcript_13322:1736-2242(-)